MNQTALPRRAWRLHIEPTSRCTLACPSCPRTWNPGYAISDVDIDRTVMACQGFKRVTFGGTNGDSIYHPRLHDLIKAIHDAHRHIGIDIITNGAFRPDHWWHGLADVLRDGDSITFSIDGLPHHNHVYRVNSKWSSIENAIKIMRHAQTRLFMIWKWIIFEHNQHDILAGAALADQLGFDMFSVVSSDRDNGKLQQTRDNADISEEMHGWLRSYHAVS